jgi:hypothetical protein
VRPKAATGGEYAIRTRVPAPLQYELAILLDPVALLVLLVLVLYGAPGDAVGAILLAVLILRGVERLLVDLLGVLGQVVLDVVRKLGDLLVGYLSSLGSSPTTS